MKYKKWLLLVVLFVLAGSLWAQVEISLSPTNLSPNSFTISTTTAGIGPADPLTNYTNQRLKYKWPYLTADYVANISVMSTSIPNGFTVIIEATGTSGAQDKNGVSTGPITLNDQYQVLISRVWDANVTRDMTQKVLISNFASLHPGTYIVTFNYRFQ